MKTDYRITKWQNGFASISLKYWTSVSILEAANGLNDYFSKNGDKTSRK